MQRRASEDRTKCLIAHITSEDGPGSRAGRSNVVCGFDLHPGFQPAFLDYSKGRAKKLFIPVFRAGQCDDVNAPVAHLG